MPKAQQQEFFKGSIHALSMCLCSTMSLYNISRWLDEDGDAHHLTYGIIYALGAVWEGKNTYDHWQK